MTAPGSDEQIVTAAARVAADARGQRPGDPITEAERENVRAWLRALGAAARADAIEAGGGR